MSAVRSPRPSLHRTLLRTTTGVLVAALLSAAVPAGASVHATTTTASASASAAGAAPGADTAPGAGAPTGSLAGPSSGARTAAAADGSSVGAGPGAVSGKGQSKAPRGTEHKGQKAVEKLGRAGVAAAAKASGVSEAELTETLLDDSSLYVDDAGHLTSVEEAAGPGATITTGAPDALLWPIASTFALHSRATSPRKIYLDFNGHITSGTPWNTERGVTSLVTPGWGRDNDPRTFTANEAAVVQATFATVVEDFAAYDVDVTTQDPGIEGLRKTSSADQAYGIRIVVGPNSWYGTSASGVAKFYAFAWSSDTPAYCFATATTSTKQIAECTSHEIGHTVGLFHDGLVNGGGEYYTGHGTWAPIMGNPYGRPVTQWSRGQYPGANNGQDDVSIIGQYLGWVADDYVGTTATTATLPAGTTRSGRLTYGVGEMDAFRFDLTVARRVNLQSWEWYQSVDTDLNMRVQLTDSRGTVLATSSPTGNLRTNMTVTLNPGTYYVFVDGVGEGTTSTGWTNYASSGFYNLLLQLV